MSSSFSIEISGDDAPVVAHSNSSSSISQEYELSASEQSQVAWGQDSRYPQGQAESNSEDDSADAPANNVSASSASVVGGGRSGELPIAVHPLHFLRQQSRRDPPGSAELQPLHRDEEQSPGVSNDGGEVYQPDGGLVTQTQQQQQPWGGLLSSASGNPARAESQEASVPGRPRSLRASGSALPPTGKSPRCEGILKRRTENWTEQSTIGEEVVIAGKSKLWVAPGTVLWRLCLCALSLRIGSSLALLLLVLVTLGQMGKAVSCGDMSNCVRSGGVMAFPVLLKALPNFTAGIVAYEAITGSLVAGLVLVLLPIAGNCYFTFQALFKGTKKAYLNEVRVTTCCTAWVSACIGVFIPPVFFTAQFCDAANFDVNSSHRANDSVVRAASENMCDQVGLSKSCMGSAVLCACSTALLLFQRYSRLWGALLGLGSTKFMLAGFLLCFTIMFAGQSSQMMLEVLDETMHAGGLQAPLITQLGLSFACLKWGGCILALCNLACGISTIWSAYLRSHILCCTNMVLNFVFFFVNAVSFFAMTFEFATLQMVCDYPAYPMVQTARAVAEAAFVCTIRPQFIFVWLLVFFLALIHLLEFLIGSALFHQELRGAKRSSGSFIVTEHSIDPLPPKWGTKR